MEYYDLIQCVAKRFYMNFFGFKNEEIIRGLLKKTKKKEKKKKKTIR
jgi:hypothetical protein